MSAKTLELTSPLKVNGEDLTKLQYDTSAITINDLGEVEAERVKAVGKGQPMATVAQADFLYQILLGMKAIIKCNPQIDFEDLKRIKGYDLTLIAKIGINFFLPPAAQEQNSSEEQQEGTQENSTVQ